MISLSFWTISLSLNCCWAQRGGKPAERARPIMCGAQRRKHTHKCFRPCGECLILSLNCCAIYKLRASRSFMSRIDYLHAFWMICHSELFRCLCTAAERSEAASRPSLRGRPCVARSDANTHTHTIFCMPFGWSLILLQLFEDMRKMLHSVSELSQSQLDHLWGA
jgi:hypothetical protein